MSGLHAISDGIGFGEDCAYTTYSVPRWAVRCRPLRHTTNTPGALCSCTVVELLSYVPLCAINDLCPQRAVPVGGRPTAPNPPHRRHPGHTAHRGRGPSGLGLRSNPGAREPSRVSRDGRGREGRRRPRERINGPTHSEIATTHAHTVLSVHTHTARYSA